MGCLRRIGCLALLVLAAAAAWYYRAEWLPYLRDLRGSGRVAEAPAGPTWEPLGDSAAARGRRAVARVTASDGPAYVELTAAELASYVLTEVVSRLPASARDVEAAVVDDRVVLRADVDLRDLGGDVLGPLGDMLGERERLQLGGTLDVVRPGVAQFRVREVRVRDLALPSAVIPRLVERIRRGPAPEGVARDALPLDVPEAIGDVRVANGRVTIYRRTS